LYVKTILHLQGLFVWFGHPGKSLCTWSIVFTYNCSSYLNRMLTLLWQYLNILNYWLSLYYHRATFLHWTLLIFLLLFPHPSIHSDISGSWGNIFKSYVCIFIWRHSAIIRCNRLQNVLDLLFAISKLPNSKSDHVFPEMCHTVQDLPWCDKNKCVCEWRLKF